MRFAITGANGFIGKRLSIKLEEQGHKVLKIQRTYTNDDALIIKDIGDFKNLKNKLKKIDVVIHCASKVHEKRIFEDKKEYLKVNTESTIGLAKESLKAGVKRFIFLSSIKVNGEITKNTPFRNKSKESPTGAYALSKYMAEQDLIKIANESSSMDVVIIRPPLVYGPKVKANFLKLFKIINSKIYLPFKKISNRRSYIFLENLVDFIIICSTNNKVSNKKLLVSDGEAISTSKLVRVISNSIGKKVRLFYVPENLLFLINKFLFGIFSKLINSLEVESSESYELTEWTPNYTFEEGINITAKWYMAEKK